MYHYHDMTEQGIISIARRVEYKQRTDHSEYASIECDVIGSDGISFGLARDPYEIDIFTGSRTISHLKVYPLKYNMDQVEIREHAISRGKKIAKLDRHSYNEISGAAMRETRIEKGETMTKEGEPKRFKFNVCGCSFSYILFVVLMDGFSRPDIWTCDDRSSRLPHFRAELHFQYTNLRATGAG